MTKDLEVEDFRVRDVFSKALSQVRKLVLPR